MVDVVGAGHFQSVGDLHEFQFVAAGLDPKAGKAGVVNIDVDGHPMIESTVRDAEKIIRPSVSVDNVNNVVTYDKGDGTKTSASVPNEVGATDQVPLGHGSYLAITKTRDGFDVGLTSTEWGMRSSTTVHAQDNGQMTVEGNGTSYRVGAENEVNKSIANPSTYDLTDNGSFDATVTKAIGFGLLSPAAGVTSLALDYFR